MYKIIDIMESTYEWEGEVYDVPSFDTIQEWVYDSVCESVLGYQVEHDGFDHEGSPSWLLVLGII